MWKYGGRWNMITGHKELKIKAGAYAKQNKTKLETRCKVKEQKNLALSRAEN